MALAAAVVPEGVFKAPAFSAEEFVGERLHIPLQRLRNELTMILTTLKSDLVELINRDYADFINLSTNLVGLDKIIVDIDGPLVKLKQDITAVRQEVVTFMNTLEAKLDNRRLLRQKKATLQLLLSVHESVGKLESLLGISDDSEPPSSDLTSARELGDAKVLERIAIEYNQLRYLTSRVEKGPFIDTIDWRISRVKDCLTENLSVSLKRAYDTVTSKPEDIAAVNLLLQILRTYLLIDKLKEAGETFQKNSLEPFLAN
ncbi:Conserved oligomeric Golgi complex subunit 2, partial [Chytridiales sp. JEL 0842]